MKTHYILHIALILSAPVAFGEEEGPYQAKPESVKQNPTPEWLIDGKFGIYAHWGPTTHACNPPGDGIHLGHYGKHMYAKETVVAFHKKYFGDPKEFGYKDICKQFNPTEFDAEAWADLFTEAGARFAGPVAVHHDNFLMWDSQFNPWNIAKVGGLKKDTTRALADAFKKRGLKFMGSFHHAHSWNFFLNGYEHGDCADPAAVDLYHPPHKKGAPHSPEFLDYFVNSTQEAWQNYEMDLIWFDFGFTSVGAETRLDICSKYYNWADKNGKKVAVVQKKEAIHEAEGGVLDFERTRPTEIVDSFWMTDMTYSTWFYRPNVNGSLDGKTLSKGRMIDILVDIVAKNGSLLLNVAPDYLGEIDDYQTEALKAMGAWLQINGEGIYSSRPWKTAGEGPTANPDPREGRGAIQKFDLDPKNAYRADDLRFTQSKDRKTVYVFALDWPAKQLAIQSMKVLKATADAKVELFGYSGTLHHRIDSETGKLIVDLPEKAPEGLDYAYGFKLTGFDLDHIPQPKPEVTNQQKRGKRK